MTYLSHTWHSIKHPTCQPPSLSTFVNIPGIRTEEHTRRTQGKPNLRKQWPLTSSSLELALWCGTSIVCHYFLGHLCCVSPSSEALLLYVTISWVSCWLTGAMALHLSSPRSLLCKLHSVLWWWRGDVANHFSESEWHAGISSSDTVRVIGWEETREVIIIWGREKAREEEDKW